MTKNLLLLGVLLFSFLSCGGELDIDPLLGNSTEKMTYKEQDSGITITGLLKSSEEETSLTIPDSIDDKPVTAIGEGAFQDTKITTLSLPASIDTIAQDAFGNVPIEDLTLGRLEGLNIPDIFRDAPLKKLTLMEGIVAVGEELFVSFSDLREIVLPVSLVYLGARAFKNTGLESVTIPLGITTISPSTFENTRIQEVVIPDTVVTIGTKAFYDTPLTRVILGEGIELIEKDAFRVETLKEVIIDADPAPRTGSHAFPVVDVETSIDLTYPSGATGYNAAPWNQFDKSGSPGPSPGPSEEGDLAIQVTGTEITILGLSQAGENTSNLVIPETIGGKTVTAIAPQAFAVDAGAAGLQNVVIPASVTSIGEEAFAGNPQLHSVVMKGATAPGQVGSNAFPQGSTILYVPTLASLGSYNSQPWTDFFHTTFESMPESPATMFTYNILNGTEVTVTGFSSGGQQETALSIPAVIENLPVTSIALESSNRSPMISAQLTTLFIPDSVTNIGIYSFANNNAMTDVTLGSGLTSLGGGVFHDVPLVSVTIKASQAPPLNAVREGTKSWTLDGMDIGTNLLRYPANGTGYNISSNNPDDRPWGLFGRAVELP